MIKTIYLTDPDLISWVEQQPNFSQYVRALIERDMAITYMRDIAPGVFKLVESLERAAANR